MIGEAEIFKIEIKGHALTFDAEGVVLFAERPWTVQKSNARYYLSGWSRHRPDGTQGTVRFHREFMNPPSGLHVDHINGDTLDNRRVNLRLCTHAENTRNAASFVGTSKFKGVHRTKLSRINPWVAQITCNRKCIHLGLFPTEKSAARAYDAAAIEYHREFARLNLPKET